MRWWVLALSVLWSFAEVIELDVTSHDAFVRDHKHSVVLYYVPWCHWCQKFIPIYKEVATAAAQALKPFATDDASTPVFGAINVNEKANLPVAKEQNIYQYPTLILHDSARGAENFEGDLTLNNVLRWIMDRTTTDLSVDTPEQLTAVLELHHSDVVVLVSNINDKLRPIYKELMEEFSDVMFGVLTNPNISLHVLGMFKAESEWVTDDQLEAEYYTHHPDEPFAALLNPHHHSDDSDKFTYDKTHHEYFAHLLKRQQNIYNKVMLTDFIKTYQFPTVARFTPSVAGRLVPSGKDFLAVFMKLPYDQYEELDNSNPSDQRLLYVEDWLWLVGSAQRHKMVTLISGTEHYYERRFMNTLSIDHPPEMVFVKVETGAEGNSIKARYRAPEDLRELIFLDQVANVSPEILRRRLTQGSKVFAEWLVKIERGQVEPDIKSEEPIPESDNNGPVRALCARTFDKEVYANTIDIVVDFYAPWCGHCRVMAPIYEKVAKAFKEAGVRDVKFAKIDATANEVPNIILRGYPTVAMFNVKDKRSPIPMAGSVQKPEDLIEFVYRTGTHKFNKRLVLHALAHPLEDEDIPKLEDEL
eukprot:Gregarina_sp_Pseudo_9__5663@NODE_7_length_7070_cov_43_502062_g5_i0_p2_GENE_NODE_7_length_7070_cov_43_502062_g5_i0NODE_7_length_7070_cov_43_502062_g5_i0_p2_ORF_typecomplete_len597_score123_95Thioredoxin/PF00085_20/1_6e12Thioredoxin/PF00085_20/6_1e02Thioredoxin/PF00085_20/1_1e04Thioredoxin/PF00085_20/1_2e19TraF/PF13728_6/1_3e07TraF/PF13728_6/0_00058Thioredoxin_6/PF13848_6/8_3e02Thioredoxin_6/PF13848_6/0_014Thioredoxin_6/PF13848_6/0_0047Thioredoxin_6/PF13848_6/0_019OST3_OST6/PF04756_13/2_6e05OST3_O